MSLIKQNSSVNRNPLVEQDSETSRQDNIQSLEVNEVNIEYSKSEKCYQLVNRFLKAVSLGKYETKLYNDGESSYSSSLGGIITIICGISIVFYAIVVMVAVFSKESYYIDQ